MQSFEHLETMAKRYDEFAPVYLNTWSKLEGYSHLVRSFTDEYVKPGMKVLDIGCGPGHFTQHFSSTTQVYGIDLSSKMLEEAQRLNPTGEFHRHNYYEPLPSEWGKFDIVLGVGSLDFCEDIDKVVGHISQSCAKGAKLLLNFCERRSYVKGHEQARLAITPERMPGVDLIFYSFEEMSSTFKKHNLAPLRYFYYKGYHNQYHDLDIQYGLWHLEKAL